MTKDKNEFLIEDRVSKTDIIDMICTEQEEELISEMNELEKSFANSDEFIELDNELKAIFKDIALEEFKSSNKKLYAAISSKFKPSDILVRPLQHTIKEYKYYIATIRSSSTSRDEHIAEKRIILLGNRFELSAIANRQKVQASTRDLNDSISLTIRFTISKSSKKFKAETKKLDSLSAETETLLKKHRDLAADLYKLRKSKGKVKSLIIRRMLESTESGQSVLKDLKSVKSQLKQHVRESTLGGLLK